jgi:hypothetical protein
MAIRK